MCRTPSEESTMSTRKNRNRSLFQLESLEERKVLSHVASSAHAVVIPQPVKGPVHVHVPASVAQLHVASRTASTDVSKDTTSDASKDPKGTTSDASKDAKDSTSDTSKDPKGTSSDASKDTSTDTSKDTGSSSTKDPSLDPSSRG
jgi:hypothetical protein